MDLARVARLDVRRGRESIGAMKLFGLSFSRDRATSDVFFLGYPNYGLEAIARADRPWTGDPTELHRGYAVGGRWRRCSGDFGYLRRGRHSRLCLVDLRRDLDDLVDLTKPSDVYTQAEFDGHPDHAEVHRQIVAALRRRRHVATVHSTLIHPAGTRDRMYESAYEWPNPTQSGVSMPFERFTPQLDFTPPPATSGGWGPLGPPEELVPVPQSVRDPDPAKNLRLRAITTYATQLDCRRKGEGSGFIHPSCGYLCAFAKRTEFFWTLRIDPQRSKFRQAGLQLDGS